MLFKLGRDKQRDWMFKSNFWDAYKINVKWGLTAYNNKIVDHGFIYDNPNHGFVDPLTGILLWLGLGVVSVRLLRRRGDEGPYSQLVSFVILWLSFAFVVNKAPNYTRLMVTLPFVGYFVAEGVRWATRWRREIRHAPVVAGRLRLSPSSWSGISASRRDFIDSGSATERRSGARAVTSRRKRPRRDVLHRRRATRRRTTPSAAMQTAIDRLALFADSPHPSRSGGRPCRPESFTATPPFALFMTRTAGTRSRRCSPTAIRAADCATSRPTARGSSSTFLRS